MYTPVVMTETYRIVTKGEQQADLEDAKTAAKKLSLAAGQMHAVLDGMNLVQWKGGVKAAAKTAAKRSLQQSA